MTSALFLFGIGLLCLYAGAEALVRGSSSLGLRLGISPLMVGLTIVAFGTSAPELVVSMSAAYVGHTDVSIGNVVGSNIANIGLILGLSAIMRPISVDVKLIRIDIPVMIAITALLALMLWGGILSRIDAVLLLAGILAFTAFNIVAGRRARPASQELFSTGLSTVSNGLWLEIAAVIAGLVMLGLGGQLAVGGAIDIARLIGVSEAVIGLTVVAVGTSLPELATSVLAAAKKMGDISVGNIVGSNIFNILCVLGASAMLTPLPMGKVTWLDIAIMMIFTVAVLPLARSDFLLKRWEGMVLLACYLGYFSWLIAGV